MVAGCASLKVFCTYLSTSDVFPTRPASPQLKVKVNLPRPGFGGRGGTPAQRRRGRTHHGLHRDTGPCTCTARPMRRSGGGCASWIGTTAPCAGSGIGVVGWRRTLAKEHHLERLGSAHLSWPCPERFQSSRERSAEAPSRLVRTRPNCSDGSWVACLACVRSGVARSAAVSCRGGICRRDF